MNEFEIALTVAAQGDIRRLTQQIQERLLDKLTWLGENATLIVHQPLQGERWAGVYKYRVGDYRILYLLDIEHRRLTVLKVGHRRDIYKH